MLSRYGKTALVALVLGLTAGGVALAVAGEEGQARSDAAVQQAIGGAKRTSVQTNDTGTLSVSRSAEGFACVIVEQGEEFTTNCDDEKVLKERPIISFWTKADGQPVYAAGLVAETVQRVELDGKQVELVEGTFLATARPGVWTIDLILSDGSVQTIDRTPVEADHEVLDERSGS